MKISVANFIVLTFHFRRTLLTLEGAFKKCWKIKFHDKNIQNIHMKEKPSDKIPKYGHHT